MDADAKPLCLSDAELGKPYSRVVSAREPLQVVAWVRFPLESVRVMALALAWTTRAVFIEFQAWHGRTLRTWVWASAVERSVWDGERRQAAG